MHRFKILFLVIIGTIFSIAVQGQCNNELVNGNADAGLTGWTFSTGTGATWAIQNNTYGSAFAASYNWTTKTQTIDLYANGYTAQYLNQQQPKISYMQMFIGHTVNFADKYYYKIELLDASNQVIDSYSYGSQTNPITTTNAWDTVSGSFSNYGTGLKYIKVECGGDDAEFWAGNYGTVIDNSVVSVAQVMNAQICSGSYPFNNQNLTTSGIYTASFTGQYGCDSSIVLNLNVGGYNIEDTFDLCDGDTFFFDGQAITTSDTVSGNFLTTVGCDSSVSYVLNFSESYSDSIYAIICPGEVYNFGNQNVTNPGVYTNSFTTVNGCDSSVVLTLDNYTEYNETVTGYLCSGDTYDFGGIPVTSPGQHNATFSTQDGCDSVVTLILTPTDSYQYTVFDTLCEGESIQLGTQIITTTGNYSEHFFTSIGSCDSIVHMIVTLFEIDESVTVDIENNTITSNESQLGTTYRWLDCKNGLAPVPGETGKSITTDQGGRFALETTLGGCVDTSSCRSLEPAGLDNGTSSFELNVFPSPADGRITIQSERMIDRLALYNQQGALVMQKSVGKTQSIELNLSDLPSGFYSLSVSGSGFQEQVSVIVQH